jgi:PAS domain S-box-containing protein
VWAFRRTAWVADVARESNMPRADHALRAGLVTAVAFPLGAADECLGVIELYASSSRQPNAEVAAMFASVGGQLAQYLSRRRLRTRARRSLDGATALVVGLDAEGRVELANATACAKLGTDEQHLIGHDWFAAAVPEPQRPGARTAFARLIAGEHGDILALDQTLAGGDGRPFPVRWRWSLARDADGRGVGALGWGEPVTQPSATDGTALVAELAAALAARERS